MGLDDLDRAKLSVLAVFLGIIVVPILYVDVYGIKTQNNSELDRYRRRSHPDLNVQGALIFHQEPKVLWVSFSTKSCLCFAL